MTEKTRQYSVSGMASQAALLYFVTMWQNLWQNTAKHFDNSQERPAELYEFLPQNPGIYRLVWMGLALCDQNPGECEMLDFQPFCVSVVDTQAALLDPVQGSSKIATG